MNRDSIDALTGLRFCAAAHVVLYHYGRPALEGWAPGWLRHLADNGYVGVSFFYILSGFLLAYNYVDRSGPSPALTGTRRDFFLKRVSRIYPLYLLAWALSAPWVIAHRLQSDATLLETAGKLLVAAGTSLGLVQAWYPGANAWWNPPSWSISVEAAFYLAFPLLIPRLARARRFLGFALAATWLSALAIPAAVVLLVATPGPTVEAALKYNPLLHLPSFAFGMLLAEVHASPLRAWVERHRLALAAASLALLAAVLCRPAGAGYLLIHNGLLAPAFGALILSSAVGLPGLGAALSSKALVRLGEASYGVYILQVPVAQGWQRLSASWRLPLLADAALYGALLCLLSLAAFSIVERPVQRLLRRRWAVA